MKVAEKSEQRKKAQAGAEKDILLTLNTPNADLTNNGLPYKRVVYA